MNIFWTKQAKEDFDLILIQLDHISPRYATDFDEKVRATIEMIKKFPNSGRIIPEIQNKRIREKLVGKFRLMYYVETDNVVKILGILHGSRHFTLDY